MAADPLSISCRNRASSNRVPTSKNKSGGSKRNTGKSREVGKQRELWLAEDAEQQYARVSKRLGDGRFEVACLGDGVTRLGHVRGKLWKRTWINPQDLVLVSLRAFADPKVDILHKFTDDEARTLRQRGEIATLAAHAEEDQDYERALQAVRDVHGDARAGFLPTEGEFDFADEME